MKIKDTVLGGKFWRWIVIFIMVLIFLFGIFQCKAQCPGTNIITGGSCTMTSIPIVPSGQTRMECFLFKPETQIIHLDYMLAQGSNCGPFQYNNLQVYIYDSTCTTLEHYSNIHPTQTNLDAVLDTSKWYQMCVNFTASCTLNAVCPQYNLSYLPVTIEYFTAKLINPTLVQLEWVSSLEYNSWYYEIQRADSNMVYNKIYKEYTPVFSTIKRYYAYTDRIPPNEVLYYRLIHTDIDGSQQIFPTVSIKSYKEISHGLWWYYNQLGQKMK